MRVIYPFVRAGLIALAVSVYGCRDDGITSPDLIAAPGGARPALQQSGGGAWEAQPSLPLARGITGSAAIGDTYYVVGGTGVNTFESVTLAYSLSSGTWSQRANIPRGHSYPAVAAVNGKVYVVGGCEFNADCRVSTSNIVDVYDPVSNQWTPVPPMPTARHGAGAVGFSNQLWVIGGRRACPPCEVSNAVEVFDTRSGQWSSRAPLPTARMTGAVVELGGAIYVIGGSNQTDNAMTIVERLDPATSTWSSVAPLPRRMYGLGATVLNNRIYVVASWDYAGSTITYNNSVVIYDPAADTWTEGPPYSITRTDPRPQTINGVIYMGGNGKDNTHSAAFEALVGVTPPQPPVPPLVVPSTTPQVSVGLLHTCALKADGTVVCWGYNGYGQAQVPGGLASVAQVSAGDYHTCALKTDGTVVCWGGGGGYGGSGQANVPGGLASVAQVSASVYHTCALKTDGTVVCWGSNQFGQTTVPGRVASVAQVDAGWGHNCALKTDRTVVCWGYDSNGQAKVPGGLASVAQVSAGDFHNCALKTDGTVVCWGYNGYGQAQVPGGLASVAQVSAGGWHSCALKTDGTVVCWGYDGYGQAKVPGGLASVAQVSAGSRHTCALKADGTVICWGNNGQLIEPPAGLNLIARPNQPPVANAGMARTVSATSAAGASVTLDGSASSDSDGDVLTFQWTGPFGAVSGVSPTVILPLGTHVVTLTVSDGKTTATSTVQITVLDTSAPLITPGVAGTLGTNGWYTGDVTVSWTVVDNESAITSSTGCGNSTVTTNVSGQVHTCTAISAGGTATLSVTINRDATVPTVTGVASGTQGTGGWYTSDVQVTWTTSSAGPSGVSPPCALETLTTDTRGFTFICDARTGAGIPGRGTVFVKRDGTAPVSTINSAVDGDGSAVASGGSTLSNSVTFMFGGTDAYGIAIFECSLDAAAFTACLSPRTYSGQAIGVHTFRVRALDLAGNSSNPATFTWTVITPAQAVQNLTTTITSMGLPAGVGNSLSAPLKNLNTSNLSAACGQLDAFVNQVNAKVKNGQLTAAASSQLLEAANAIKKSLGCG